MKSPLPAGVDSDSPYRQDPTYLWRDLLAVHSAFPMHVLIGGGDQVRLKAAPNFLARGIRAVVFNTHPRPDRRRRPGVAV